HPGRRAPVGGGARHPARPAWRAGAPGPGEAGRRGDLDARRRGPGRSAGSWTEDRRRRFPMRHEISNQGGETMARYGTVGYNLGTAGRWSRFGLGLLVAAGTIASALLGHGPAQDPATLLATTALCLAGIAAAYLVAYALLGERVFARAHPWLNTLILVGPALTIAYWNLTLGAALGVALPAALTLAMLAYVGASLVLESFLGYGGCEGVALPILVLRRR